MALGLGKQTIIGVGLLLASGLVTAADSTGRTLVEQGNDRGAAACAACHGSDGAGNAAAGFPRLAGINQRYLAKQLQDFKAGRRSNVIMDGIAAALSDEEIDRVSSYFAGLDTPASPPAESAAAPAAGKQLAVYGDWNHDVPACFRCHGDQARGGGPVMPALAGQHAGYLQTQLQAWKAGERDNDPVGLMSAIAARLSDTQIESVAAYLASLTPPAVK